MEDKNIFAAAGPGKALALALNLVIAVYAVAVAYFIFNGPVDARLAWGRLRMRDGFAPMMILLVAGVMRAGLLIRWTRNAVFTALTLAVSAALGAAAGEAVLRIKYPGELAPPPYIYNMTAKYSENGRGPYSGGPKRPGVKRIMVQGDSITWGVAVPDWREVYPYKLLSILNKDSEKYEMQVWAAPGMQVDYHAKIIAMMGEEVKPDLIIYQWLYNDLEVWADRPGQGELPWARWKANKFLIAHSIFYRLLDARLSALLYQDGRQYADYLREKITPGKKYWWYYEMEFHKWATGANHLAQRTIILMYPSLPYSGEYPFTEVTRATLALLKPHDMRIPAAYLLHNGGTDEAGLGSTYELARVARKGVTPPGHIVFGPYINFARGAHEAGFALKLLSPAAAGARVAKIEVVCAKGRRILASRMALGGDFDRPGQWQKLALPFRIDEAMERDVEFRVEYLGEADLAVDTIDVPVDYKIEMVDPMGKLKDFNTHARLFDAHPSARAHTVIAEALAERILNGPRP
jgi:hypothetical protein